jgi:superfamily II RNA helicase
MRNWELRGAQKELRAMHQYAKSLVGADCLHHPIALVQQDDWKSRKQTMAAPQVESGPKMSKKAQEIIAKNMASQQKALANKDSDQIKPLLERAEAISEVRDFKSFESCLFDLCAGYSRIIDSFDGFKGISASVKLVDSQIKVIVTVLKSIKTALKKLIPSATSHMATDTSRLGARNACAKVVRLCCSFVQEYACDIEGKDIQRVQELLISLGFTHTSKNLFALWKSKREDSPSTPEDSEKSKKSTKDAKESKKKSTESDEYYVKSSKVEELIDITGGDEFLFQLVHLNSELDRPAGTLSDKRVMFKPDYWQRELLDIVDRNESALVCAPTASGKTFICYYAMEKVLRSSNDKVAVYVAPSKALMNQVDAEIYARFRSKAYPATEHFHLSGDLEKDYQHNPFNCQVLVTIPAMLEQLLLDPTMQDWVSRIEYVIFDEVHCMGESADDSAIWEHALQLIQCPFLAMSATVGNPSKFHDWLNYVAKIKGGPKVHLI